MSAGTTKPVWVWLPDSSRPVRAGEFTWREGLGEFIYDHSYMAMPGAFPFDPISMPFSRSKRSIKETKQNGVFGAIRDASPEGYGLSLLETIEGRALDPLERLETSLGDGVGAIEVCDDIERKVAFHPLDATMFLDVLALLPEGVAPSRAVRNAHGVEGTTLGGERPKMTVMHKGQLWIAKLQDRGDAPNSPLREYLAMRSARACGINAAEVEFHRAGPHQVVLVKRFDREVTADRSIRRRPFVSAHTALRLDSTAMRGDPARSYPYLANELQRWAGLPPAELLEQKRELWRRMVFNALCGNGDDHPRNHGLLRVDGSWKLSPAYDIAPYKTFNGTLAMAIDRDGHSQAARWALLRSCDLFGYERLEADAYISATVPLMQQVWLDELEGLGVSAGEAPPPRAMDWIESPEPAGLKPLGRRGRPSK